MFKNLPAAVKPFALRCCAFNFIAQITPISILYLLYMRDTGLSAAQSGFLMGFWYITALIFEIPSSVIADRFSRRHVVMAGEISSAFGFLLLWLYPTWWGFLVGIFFWAIRGSFYSGTFDAYIYDELKTLDAVDAFTPLRSLLSTWTWIGGLLASFTVGLYHTHGIYAIVLISVVSRLIGAFILWGGPEVAKQKFLTQTTNTGIFKAAAHTLKQHPDLIYLLLLGPAMGVLTLTIDYRPLLFDEMALPKTYESFFLAGTTISLILGSYFAHRLPLHTWRNFMLFTLLPIGTLVLFSVIQNAYLAFACLLVALLLEQIWSVHSGAQKQDKIPSDVRATLGSLNGLWDRGLTIIMSNVIGISVARFGYQQAMSILAIPALCLLFGYGIVVCIQSLGKRHVRDERRP